MRRAGRALLWCLVAMLLVRGAADLFERSAPAASGAGSSGRDAAWPDDEARAFAVEFARAYLSHSPRRPERYADAVRGMAVPELADTIAPERDDDARERTVAAAGVARTVRLDAQHALVTVAAAGSEYLTVPVARDVAGGLAVYDHPSFAPPPARGVSAAASLDALPAADAEEIHDLLERFFGAYLAGDARALAYFAPAGVPMPAMAAHRHQLVQVVSLARGAGGGDRSPEVLATVRARDVASGAVYALRYRLRLVRGDRWLVSEVNNATRKEG